MGITHPWLDVSYESVSKLVSRGRERDEDRELHIFGNQHGYEKDETKITSWITRKMIEYVM